MRCLQLYPLIALLLLLPLISGCRESTQLTAEAKIQKAWDLYRLGEFSLAVRSFQSVEKSEARGSENYLQAAYGEACCWNYRRDDRNIPRAVSLYQEVIEQGSSSPLASWCALELVHTEHFGPADQPVDTAELSREYSEVQSKYPATEAGEEAFLYSVSLRLYPAGVGESEKIAAEIENFVQGHLKSPYLSTYYLLLARAWSQAGNPAKGLKSLIQITQLPPDQRQAQSPDLSGVYWAIAYTAEYEVGDFAVARDYCHRLIEQYPTNIHVLAAKLALTEMDATEAAIRQGKPLPPGLVAGSAP